MPAETLGYAQLSDLDTDHPESHATATQQVLLVERQVFVQHQHPGGQG